jgi:hypothetical protein
MAALLRRAYTRDMCRSYFLAGSLSLRDRMKTIRQGFAKRPREMGKRGERGVLGFLWTGPDDKGVRNCARRLSAVAVDAGSFHRPRG